MPAAPYVDPQVIHNPATGSVAPAAWGDQVRDDLEFLIDPPCCSISNTAETVASGVGAVALGATSTENFDNDAMHSTVSNRTRVTAQTAGRYLCLGNVVTDTFAGVNNSFIRISLRVNGTTAIGGSQLKNTSACTEAVRLTLARAITLAVGDFIEITMTQNLGGSVQATLDELIVTFLTR